MAQKEPRNGMTVVEAKRWLRKYMFRERIAIPQAYRRGWSRAITGHLIKTPFYKKARVIAMFLGFGSEVQTDSLLEQARKDGKVIVIPVTPFGFHRAYFALFLNGDVLTRTKYGPFELVKAKKTFPFSKIDLVLVPGLGFDGEGHRLGYGGGVYDRLLAKTSNADHVGLFFTGQQVHRFPAEQHDRPLHAVVTEKGVVRCLA